MNHAWLGKGSRAAPHCVNCLTHSMISWNLKGYECSFVGWPLSSPTGIDACSVTSWSGFTSGGGDGLPICKGETGSSWWALHSCSGSGAWGKQLWQWCSSTTSVGECPSLASRSGSKWIKLVVFNFRIVAHQSERKQLHGLGNERSCTDHKIGILEGEVSRCWVTMRHLPVSVCCQCFQIKFAAALGSSSISQSCLIKNSPVTIHGGKVPQSDEHLQRHRWDEGTESFQK